MDVPARYWAFGVAAAVLAHTVIFTVLYWESPDPGARGAGALGVEVALGPAGGSPGSVAASADSTEAESAEPPATASETPVEEAQAARAETVEAPTIDAAATADPQSIEASSAEQAKAPQPELVSTRNAEQAEVRTNANPVEQPEPETVEQVEEPEAEATQGARPEPPPEQTVHRATPETETTARTAPEVAGTAGKAGDQAKNDSGTGNDASRGGTPGAPADYMARLQAWLEKHKRYPRRARLRRLEGTALLRFVLDRQGRVLDHSIRQSSGHEVLDKEVTAMIQRAEPLPGFPADMSQSRLELVVPVQFFLM